MTMPSSPPDAMLAVRVHGPGDLRVDRVPVPVPGPGDLLLRMLAAGVCATDRKLAARGAPGAGPRVLGHEIVAEVVGGDDPRLKSGTRVAVAPNLGEGSCPACRRGATNLCPDYRAFGIHLDGGMAEYMLAPRAAVQAGHLLPLPEALSDLDAALLEPLACCVEGLEASGLRAGESLLVVAAGVMGRLHVAAARALGAGTVIVADRSAERLAHARALGADVAVRVNGADDDATGAGSAAGGDGATGGGDLAAAVAAATDGAGVDVAAVTIGDAAATRTALACLAREGRLNLFAGYGAGRGGLEIDANDVHYRGLRVLGTSGASLPTLARTLALLAAGRIDLRGLVSATFPLQDAARAFAAAGEREHARVVLTAGPR